MNAVMSNTPVCYFQLRVFLSWKGRGEGEIFWFGYF